jgi:hypothetical protein
MYASHGNRNPAAQQPRRIPPTNKKASPFVDINGVVAAFLDDVAGRPAPRGVEARLSEIRQTVSEGTATLDMALEIIDMFARDEVA